MSTDQSERPASSACGILVLSGPSGSGKTTIVEQLLQKTPVGLVKAISATTRPPRSGEVEGENYFFLSEDDFHQRREADEFLEYAEVHRTGYWYGTLKSEIQRAHSQQKWVLLEIDVEGALNVMQMYPEALTIFLTTSDLNEYESRLRSRGTETDEQIQTRLATAQRELTYADQYQHQVINDRLERAVSEICGILEQANKAIAR